MPECSLKRGSLTSCSASTDVALGRQATEEAQEGEEGEKEESRPKGS